MGMYRKEWECCNSVTETDAWEPDECPFCSAFNNPVRTKDLTDDEVAKAYMECTGGDIIARCRVIIAADREKNK